MPPYNNPVQSPPTPEKKRRLSHLFGGGKKEDLAPPAMDQKLNHQWSTSTNGGIAADSAYASSDGPSSKRNSRADIQPIENNGRIEGVSQDRSLDVNNRTGEVFDHDTGEVVSTVTTTTTTTTTTVHKGAAAGKKGTTVQVETHRQQQENTQPTHTQHPEIAEAPGDRPRREESLRIAESQRQAQHNVAPPLSDTWQDPRMSPPARNPNRKSTEFADGSSPYKHNFSYPSRTELKNDENPVSPISSPPPPQPSFGFGGGSSSFGGGSSSRPKSTLENLKSAAIGLHGVGETLRGTLNNEVDSRFPRHNAEKAAAAEAKNRSTLDRGNAELARLQASRSHQNPNPVLNDWEQQRDNRSGAPQIPPQHFNQDRAPSRSPRPLGRTGATDSFPPPPPGPPPVPGPATYRPTGDSAFGGPSGFGGPQEKLGGPPEPATTHPAFRPSYEAEDEIHHVQPTFTPESSGTAAPAKKESGFRKLIKRRAVGGS
nr:hypothetical protein B0A51_05609 [Rachicladosporium sp. CCFEE 5018]